MDFVRIHHFVTLFIYYFLVPWGAEICLGCNSTRRSERGCCPGLSREKLGGFVTVYILKPYGGKMTAEWGWFRSWKKLKTTYQPVRWLKCLQVFPSVCQREQKKIGAGHVVGTVAWEVRTYVLPYCDLGGSPPCHTVICQSVHGRSASTEDWIFRGEEDCSQGHGVKKKNV